MLTCEKTYTGIECWLVEHATGVGDRMTNSLFMLHFMETGQKFINLLENFDILKTERDSSQHKLLEVLEILSKGNNRLINIQMTFNNEEMFLLI